MLEKMCNILDFCCCCCVECNRYLSIWSIFCELPYLRPDVAQMCKYIVRGMHTFCVFNVWKTVFTWFMNNIHRLIYDGRWLFYRHTSKYTIGNFFSSNNSLEVTHSKRHTKKRTTTTTHHSMSVEREKK